MIPPLSPVAAASKNLSSPWLKRWEGMGLPIDVRLSLNYRLHSQDSEVVVDNPPVCLRVCRLQRHDGL